MITITNVDLNLYTSTATCRRLVQLYKGRAGRHIARTTTRLRSAETHIYTRLLEAMPSRSKVRRQVFRYRTAAERAGSYIYVYIYVYIYMCGVRTRHTNASHCISPLTHHTSSKHRRRAELTLACTCGCRTCECVCETRCSVTCTRSAMQRRAAPRSAVQLAIAPLGLAPRSLG
jgi:hypothetical protein